MGERSKYTPGTFNWMDVTTTDQEGAKAFYGGLFGWQTTDMPAGEGATYTMASVGGKTVGAIAPQQQAQRDAGVPPTWNSYVTVESADRTLERATKLGATVHSPAFDVMEAGRMGVIQDLQGAFVLIWEPKSHIGASLVNAPGALSWNELASPDPDAAAPFYRDLFEWSLEPMEGTPMTYIVVKNRDGWSNGGIRQAMDGEPTYWLVYIGTDDVDAGTVRATELGGTKIVDPMDIGPGRFSVVQDPQGAVFALYSGHFDE